MHHSYAFLHQSIARDRRKKKYLQARPVWLGLGDSLVKGITVSISHNGVESPLFAQPEALCVNDTQNYCVLAVLEGMSTALP